MTVASPDTSDDTRPDTATAVRVRGLVKEFETSHGTVRALDGVDLDLEEGEFLVIVGPSGCGKTTLLNIIAGLVARSQGDVTTREAPRDQPLLSVVFQEQGVFPWMTVLDNAAFGLKARGVAQRERHEIAREVLRSMGLSAFEAAYPRQLSGGMRQRVNLARAFANDPLLLLMDEPFAGLDEQTKLLLQDDLLELWEGSSKTVLFITHSLDEAVRLADRVVVMSARPGRVKAVVTIDLPRPRNVLELESDDRYANLHRQVWEHLREEVLAARERELGGAER